MSDNTPQVLMAALVKGTKLARRLRAIAALPSLTPGDRATLTESAAVLEAVALVVQAGAVQVSEEPPDASPDTDPT